MAISLNEISLCKRIIYKFITKLIGKLTYKKLKYILNQLFTRDNAIQNETSHLLLRTLDIGTTSCGNIMTPKSQVECLKLDANMNDILNAFYEGHSRFPVVNNDDTVVGILVIKDFWEALCKKKTFDTKINLSHLIRPVVTVPESKRILVLLKELRDKRNHIAIVIDEYGKFSGIVSIEDIVEELVGEIEDEHDDVVNNIKESKPGTYKMSALMPVQEFNKLFNASISEEYKTMSGWLLDKVGEVPQLNEEFFEKPFLFKVVAGNARKIDYLQVQLTNEPNEKTKNEPT